MKRFLKTLPALALLLFALPSLAAEIDPPACWPAAGANHNAFGQAARQKLNFPVIDYPSSYILTGIKVYGMKVGSPTDNVVVSVYEGDATSGTAGYISGALLTSATLSGAAWPSGAHDIIEITFDNSILVEAGDDLAIQFDRSGADSGTDYYRLNGQNSCIDGVETDNFVKWTGASWTTDGEGPRMVTLGTLDPACVLTTASAAALSGGQQTIYAAATCQGFFPSSAWIGAVRLDPVGSHLAWSEGFGPFPDPYSFETTDGIDQAVSNGLWRVRAYAMNDGELITSGYIDLQLDGNPYLYLTDTGTPGDWELDPSDALLTASTTGETGYYFSASTAAIVAAGGLVITPDGCAAVGEDATSTGCVFLNEGNWLTRAFPLLTWPTGIFQAFYDAASNTENASTAYSVALPSHGDWIPEVIVVDSASRTLGIGAYIPVSAQDFFRSILTFGVWVAFVYRLRSYANRLV